MITCDYFNYKLTENEKFQLCMDNLDKVDWKLFAHLRCSEAIEYLKNNQDKIDWDAFSCNQSDEAIELLLQNKDKINWKYFSTNGSDKAIDYLKANPHMIKKWRFFLNSNFRITEILEDRLELFKGLGDMILDNYWGTKLGDAVVEISFKVDRNKVDWRFISSYDSDRAIELLKQNQDMISWKDLKYNKHKDAAELLKMKPN